MKRNILLTCLALCGMLFVQTHASAAVMLEFDDVNDQGGTISYDGAGGAAVGSDIVFDTIKGLNTTANSGFSNRLTLENGSLNFETGANISEGPNAWDFSSAGSTFDLTATRIYVDANNNFAYDAGETVIDGDGMSAVSVLSGSFVGTPDFTTQTLSVFEGFGVDEKNSNVLAYFNVSNPNEFVFANTQITSSANIGADGSFSANVVNADLNNTQVPEPTSLAVLGGLSVLGLAGLRRRNRKA